MQTKKSTIDTQIRKINSNTLKIVIKPQEERTRRREESNKNKSKTVHKMAFILNVNGLNAPTKRHRLAEWIPKQDPYICCLQETHFTSRDTYKLKVRG